MENETTENIMDENKVVEYVIQKLNTEGWKIVSKAHTRSHGKDIEAIRNGKRLIIEAKGATSSKPESRKFGETWGKDKLSHSLAQAILKVMEIIAENKDRRNSIEFGIALPDVPYYRSTIQKIQEILVLIGIKVYLVSVNAIEVI